MDLFYQLVYRTLTDDQSEASTAMKKGRMQQNDEKPMHGTCQKLLMLV